METEYVYPELMDRWQADKWEKDGSRDLFEVARERTQELMADHYPNYFGAQNDAKIREMFPITLPEAAMRSTK